MNNNKETNNFDIVSVLVNIFNNPDTDYIIRLYNTPIEKFDEEFDAIIKELQERGNEDLIADLTAHKEQIRTQAKLFYRYGQLSAEKEKRTHRSYFKSTLDKASAMQQSDDRKSQLLGDIITIQTYIHHTAALIDKGSQNSMITNIYRHLQTHLFDVINDIMAICNLEDIDVPRDICDDLFNLSLGVDKEYEELVKEMSPELSCGFSFGGASNNAST